ncbi:MAG: thiol-disulfide oxidoreductase DCC family protein [Rhodothermales bacterium]
MPSHPIILFDGVCNLCNASVNFVIDRDPHAVFRFGALQSEEGRRVLAQSRVDEAWLDSIVLIDGDGVHTASDAALRIASRMPFPWSWLRVFRIVPRALRDAVYHWVARNRYRWFGKQETCRIPTPELQARFIDAGPAAEAIRNSAG